MSLETWKKEFYPVPASTVSEKNAVKHCLQKWTGLLKKNLRKHSVKSYDICDSIGTGSTSCALCLYYLDDNCVSCPIFLETRLRCEDSKSHYIYWLKKDSALPLVQLLRRISRNEVATK